MSIRVRYAPSPTGYQHIGGIRTALVNYLFARSKNGTFVVRIEDTDRVRSQDKYFADLYSSLEWLTITPDESGKDGPYEPYIQSHRNDIYLKYINQLLAQGDAYYCFTSPQKKDSAHIPSEHNNNYTDSQYDRSSRNLSTEEINTYKKQGIIPVVRLKMPLEGKITIEDELLGKITREVKDIITDPILLKSDGFPTYHIANVIDDHLMHITHVIRSQEWIPSIPVHLYLYKCFDWAPPKFFHLPLVLGEDGQKLSKRNGSLSIKEVKRMGILPEALINCIVLLGWSFDDSREFFTLEELEHLFSKGKLNTSPSKFSMNKLKWFNAHYIRQLSIEQLCKLIWPYFLEKKYLVDSPEDYTRLLLLTPLIQTRLELLSDAPILLNYVFEEIHTLNFDSLIEKNGKEVLREGLHLATQILEENWELNPEKLEQKIRKTITDPSIKKITLGQILMPLRIAITGSSVSPPILPLIKIIGKKTVLNRIEKSLAYL